MSQTGGQQHLNAVRNEALHHTREGVEDTCRLPRVDAILLDCFMPEMNGPQTLQLIRSMPGHKRTPVIFLTGNSERNMVMSAINLHPAGFLVKPVRKDELLNKIDDVLDA